MNKLVMLVAATLALAAPAHPQGFSADVGNFMKFNKPNVGCHHPADALEAARLRQIFGQPHAERFALQTQDWEQRRACVIFKGDPRDEYRIADKRDDGTSFAFFCVTPTLDFNVGPPDREKSAKPAPCFWVYMDARATGEYRR